MAEITHSFSTRRGRHFGNATIEILKDGDPFWEDLPGAKDHFRFGVEKAILILSCMREIKQFFDSERYKSVSPKRTEIDNRNWRRSFDLFLHGGFKRGDVWIDRPYLEIRGDKNIAFGRLKAEAIILLEKELERFAIGNYKTD